MKKPFIFITNDDGVNARGLKAVTEVALRFGRVVVIAPETTQSGMAHAVTMYSPLYLRTVEKRGDLTVYACSGTPVDCVKMGYDHIFAGERPALNISGINHGSNSSTAPSPSKRLGVGGSTLLGSKLRNSTRRRTRAGRSLSVAPWSERLKPMSRFAVSNSRRCQSQI